MTLYQELRAAGVTTDSHNSDLYFPKMAESTAILDKYPMLKKQSSTFRSNIPESITEPIWYEVPFAFEPYWDKKQAAARQKETT